MRRQFLFTWSGAVRRRTENAVFVTPGRETSEEIHPSRLCPGLFIRLPSGWMAHPFLFNQFRITSEKQVEVLRALGLTSITWVPSRSTASPLPAASEVAPLVFPDEPEKDALAEERKRRLERQGQQRARIAQCEKHYLEAADSLRDVMRGLHADPGRAVVSSREVVAGLVETFGAEGDLVIHLMGERVVAENPHYHALNVMIVALLLGRTLRLLPGNLRILGEGALFHDLGKCRVPDSVLRNPERNHHEEEFYRLHTLYGGDLAREMDIFPPEAIAIIESHHETLDGKGYPRGLAGDALPLLARVVGLANRYDNLCNALREDRSMTPAAAMTHLYRNEQKRWGKELLEALIRTLGVYPPGSVVQLSNGNTAVVLAVDSADLLRPEVLVYDPSVPRSEALIVDLSEAPDVKVEHVLSARELQPEVRSYLVPTSRLSLYPAKGE